MEKVILISGSSFGSGKNTVGYMLDDLYSSKGKRVVLMAFADWVKDSVARYYGKVDKTTSSGRSFYQHYATDVVRAADPTYWAETTIRLAHAIQSQFDILIITDWRFPNEELVTKLWFDKVFTIRVDRPKSENENIECRNHISENALTNHPIDYIIKNDGTINDLSNTVTLIYNQIEGKAKDD